MSSLFKIEEAARETGLTKRAIRYYEEIGILPAPERSEGGIRLYTREQIDRLKKVVNAKEVLGFSLQELHRYITAADYLDSQRQDYREAKDEGERKEKLVEIERTLNEQLALMQRKIQNIQSLQIEMEDLRIRVRKALTRMEQADKREQQEGNPQ